MNKRLITPTLIVSFIIIIILFTASDAQAVRSYWQQDVSYKMNVKLAEDGRTLLGQLQFHYKIIHRIR